MRPALSPLGKLVLPLIVAIPFLIFEHVGWAQSDYFGGESIDSLQQHLQTLASRPRPYWLVDSNQIDTFKALRTQSPWAQWYGSFVGTADNVPSAGIDTSNGWWEYQRLMYLAGAYVLSDDAQKKNQYLTAIQSSIHNLPPSNLASDEGQVDALWGLAVTYDLVYDQLTQAERDQAKATATIWVDFFKQYNEGSWMQHAPGSNHHHRMSIAIALAGLCFGVSDWLEHGLRHLKIACDNSFSSDGIFDHGPDYLRYGMLHLSTLAVPYQRIFGVNFLQINSPPAYSDLMFQALVEGRRPDMWPLNFDDAAYDIFDLRTFLPLLSEADIYRWHLADASRIEPTIPMELFFFYQEGGRAEPPWNPTRFLLGEHHAYFRRDWSPQSSMLALLGETRPSSAAHFNFDQTSFVFFAHGQMLVIDPGYGGWSETHGTQEGMWDFVSSRAHNLIMADGTGPVESQGWVVGGTKQIDSATLSRMLATSFIDTADVTCRYAYLGDVNSGGSGQFLPDDNVDDVQVNRTIFYSKKLGTSPENEYAVIADRLEAQQAHDYDWVIHADGTLSAADPDGYDWSKNGVQMIWRLYSPDSISMGIADNFHYDENKGKKTHTRIMARVLAAQNTQFIAILYPRTGSLALPAIAKLVGANGAVGARLTVEGVEDVSFIQANGSGDTIANIKSNCTAGFVRKRLGLVDYFCSKQCTEMQIDGTLSFRSDKPVTIAIQMDRAQNERAGSVSATERTVLEIPCPVGNQVWKTNLEPGTTAIRVNLSACSPKDEDGSPTEETIEFPDAGEPLDDQTTQEIEAGHEEGNPTVSGNCGCGSDNQNSLDFFFPFIFSLALKIKKNVLGASCFH